MLQRTQRKVKHFFHMCPLKHISFTKKTFCFAEKHRHFQQLAVLRYFVKVWVSFIPPIDPLAANTTASVWNWRQWLAALRSEILQWTQQFVFLSSRPVCVIHHSGPLLRVLECLYTPSVRRNSPGANQLAAGKTCSLVTFCGRSERAVRGRRSLTCELIHIHSFRPITGSSHYN